MDLGGPSTPGRARQLVVSPRQAHLPSNSSSAAEATLNGFHRKVSPVFQYVKTKQTVLPDICV